MKKTERSKPSAGRTSRASYRRHPMSLVQRIAVTASAVITFAILVALLAYILIMGVPNLKPGLFAWHYTSDNCSMTPAIINTLLMVVLSLLLSVPFGIGAAIYLVEYAKRGNKLVKVVRLTAETLSGIPSIVYGLFGYLMFVIALNMDKSMLAGALTLAIMVLPTILRTTEEAPEGRARFVPRGQLRPRRGQAAHGVPHRAAVGRARHLLRHHSGHRPHRRRDGRPHLYGRYVQRASQAA